MIGRLTIDQIDEVLKNNTIGHIGCNDGKKTYVVPVNYVFDGKSIIGHSCFAVDEMKSFTNWKSVILWGEYEELKEERDRYAAMKLFVDRTIRMKISETAIPPEISEQRVHPRSPGNIKPIIYRIIITEKTGRFENE